MIVLGLEEFSAKRRPAQTRIEDALRPIVARALDGGINTDGYRELIGEVASQWQVAYADESGENAPNVPARFRDRVLRTLRKTDRAASDETTVERIAVWLATAILSNATMAAAKDDPEELFLQWVDMGDDKVRAAHHEANGQVRPIGEKFDVGGYKMDGPGDPDVPIELWINDRCTLRPILPEDALVASAAERVASTVVVALPAAEAPVHDIGEEQKHVTLAFLGEFDGDADAVQAAAQGVAGSLEPFTAMVSGSAVLGPDKAKVVLVEEIGFAVARDRLLDNDTISEAVSSVDTHPHFVPHMTLTYDDDAPEFNETEIVFDRLAVWHGEDQTEYALGAEMSQPTDEKPTTDDAPPENADAQPEDVRVPFHTVLAPEGIKSGDGRRFLAGTMRSRPLPLPISWQKSSSTGHGGSVTVAKMERAVRAGNEIRAEGFFVTNVEADEVVGLIAEFGRFGISVDADDASFEMNDEEECVDFTDERLCSASIVAIPAFSQAWIALGYAPEGFMDEEEDEALVAADLAPGVTEDGPGWLTHPVDTDRLRDYWVRGEGAAKIAWGVPGDFNRCRLALAEYVKPEYLNGYCANRHKDALGVWPGQEASVSEGLDFTEAAESISLVASVGPTAPAAWFRNPGYKIGDPRLAEQPDGTFAAPLKITEDGRVSGHIAAWTTCHAGFPGECVTPPFSASGYAHFLLGEVLTDEGTVACGSLTIGGGHAPGRARARAALAHYENSCAAFADVTVGEDEFGIWCAGWVRPGTPDEMVHAARASKLSGDWRKVSGQYEMIAALAVNVPGYRVLRPAASLRGPEQVSLVAAGMVSSEVPAEEVAKIDLQELALAVAEQIDTLQQNRSKMAALAARVNGDQ